MLLYHREIELWTGLICGCFPALRPLLHYCPAIFSSLSRSLKGSRSKTSDGRGGGSHDMKKNFAWLKSSKGSMQDSAHGDVYPYNINSQHRSFDGEYVELNEPIGTTNHIRTIRHGDPIVSSTASEGGIQRTVEVDVTKSPLPARVRAS